MKVKYVHPADQIVDAMSRVYARDMTTITGGNISLRDENGDTWISPTRLDKASLQHKDICVLRANGDLEGLYKPSIEYRFHLGLLDNIPGCTAVIHAHCPNATAFCALDRYPDLSLWHACKKVFKEEELGRVPFFVPGSDELKDAITEQGKLGKTVIFMDNHGILVGGKDMDDAFAKIEMIEKLSAIDLLTHRMGAVKRIEGDLVSYAREIEVKPALETSTLKESLRRKEVAHFAARAYNKGIMNAVSGSYSARVDENSFVITADGCDAKEVQPEELVLVKDGVAYGGKPSEEWKIHEEIYKKNPKYNACYIVSPTYAMVYASNEDKMDLSIYMGLRAYSGMKRLPYHSTLDDVVNAINEEDSVAMVYNRCYIIATADPQRSFNELESLEEFAMVQVRAGKQNWRGLQIKTQGE
ncbi:MAG: class II aldolase/adducin family protein [Erysipelotrichaceae bacterium]|nr:class II aldolase/adducin family protein [Erysipelotrichaceae bacterium]